MAKHNPYQTLSLKTSAGDYPIIIGRGLIADVALLQSLVTSSQVMIVSNETIAPLYLDRLLQAFSDRQCDTVILKDGEAYKNEQSLFQIYAALLEKKHHRDTTVIALGGGVVGDIAGFAAATYQRGVACVQIPTTLLAQVDASVGGKTAINFAQGKNMVGSFAQAKAVLIDLDTLETLNLREFRAGLAEIIKYAMLEGGSLQAQIDKALKNGLADKDCPELGAIIAQCCGIKAAIVEQDEREQNVRALLNLGHTFGHALEAYTAYKRWLHGEAVAIGLYAATLLSKGHFGLSDEMLNLIDVWLERAKLPRRIPKDIDLRSLQGYMSSDKKIKNKTQRFVLCRAMGACELVDTIPEDLIWTVLQSAIE